MVRLPPAHCLRPSCGPLGLGCPASRGLQASGLKASIVSEGGGARGPLQKNNTAPHSCWGKFPKCSLEVKDHFEKSTTISQFLSLFAFQVIGKTATGKQSPEGQNWEDGCRIVNEMGFRRGWNERRARCPPRPVEGAAGKRASGRVCRRSVSHLLFILEPRRRGLGGERIALLRNRQKLNKMGGSRSQKTKNLLEVQDSVLDPNAKCRGLPICQASKSNDPGDSRSFSGGHGRSRYR